MIIIESKSFTSLKEKYGFNSNEKLNGRIFYSKLEEIEYVLKFYRRSHFLSRHFFEKEKFFSKNTNPTHHLKTPRLIEFEKNFIVSHYISGINFRSIEDLNKYQKVSFIKALISFNTQKMKLPRKMALLDKVFLSPFTSLIRISISKIMLNFGFRAFLKTLFIVFKNNVLMNKSNKRILLHKDLSHRGNKIVTHDEKFGIIDFEYTIFSSKWILLDIVDVCFDPKELTIDVESIKKYYKILTEIHGYKIKSVETQIRLILMRRIGNLAHKKNIRSKVKDFYVNTLLNDDVYKKWYKYNIALYAEEFGVV